MHILETLIGKNTVTKMCQLFPGTIDEIKIRRCAAHKQRSERAGRRPCFERPHEGYLRV